MTAQTELLPKEHRDAKFSRCRQYRYTLDIIWGGGGKVQFIGLNPSTADEISDDPTVRRCKQFAKNWGYGGMVMTNLFAYRATDPRVMKRHPAPIGEPTSIEHFDTLNDYYLWETSLRCEMTVAAWGNHGVHLSRAEAVRKLISPMKAFRMTKENEPSHPLYMPYEIKLIELENSPVSH